MSAVTRFFPGEIADWLETLPQARRGHRWVYDCDLRGFAECRHVPRVVGRYHFARGIELRLSGGVGPAPNADEIRMGPRNAGAESTEDAR